MKREKLTGQDKRKLTYDKPFMTQQIKEPKGLEIHQSLRGKISEIQYKKIKEAFFIEASLEYTLSRSKFATVIRSLGIIQKTSKLYEIFDEIEKKEMSWKQFLQAYVALRNQKGSYNELAQAVYTLDKEYRGDWDQFFEDLQIIGDIMSAKEVEIFKNEILQGKTVNNEELINSLLGYK